MSIDLAEVGQGQRAPLCAQLVVAPEHLRRAATSVTSARCWGTAGNPNGRSLMGMMIVDRFDLADGAFPLTARATRGVQSTRVITPARSR